MAHSIERLTRDLHFFVTLIAVAVLSASLLVCWGAESFPLELLTHFHIQYAAVGIFLILYEFCRRSYRFLAVGALITLLTIPALIPYLIRSNAQPSRDPVLTMLVLNVHTKNTKREDVVHVLQTRSADVIGVLEVNQVWADALATLSVEYPYTVFEPRDDNFGLALLSKRPLSQVKSDALQRNQPPTIIAQIEAGPHKVLLSLTHPVPPISTESFNLRNSQLDSIASMLSDEPMSVLMGDLNCSPWSPFFERLLRNGRLRDTRKGVGLLPTWPSQFPLLLTPIDHILVGQRIVSSSLESVSIPGSDHRGLFAQVSLQAE